MQKGITIFLMIILLWMPCEAKQKIYKFHGREFVTKKAYNEAVLRFNACRDHLVACAETTEDCDKVIDDIETGQAKEKVIFGGLGVFFGILLCLLL